MFFLFLGPNIFPEKKFWWEKREKVLRSFDHFDRVEKIFFSNSSKLKIESSADFYLAWLLSAQVLTSLKASEDFVSADSYD